MSKTPDDRANEVVRDFLKAARGVIDAVEQLKKADAKLSLEAARPPLKIAKDGAEGRRRDD